jgi:general secretion pathway protein A
MYLQHFSLEKSPFSLTPDPRFLFWTAKHREALAALLFGITERKGFLVMTGEAGSGKTTLIRKLLLSLPATAAQFSVVINPALTRSELLESVLMDFGVKEVPSSKAVRLSLFKEMLVKGHQDGKISVLVVDEAHLLGAELIEEIRLLSNFETSEQKLLQIVLVGQKELNKLLNLPSMTQVRQRVAIRMQLDPLGPKETERYLRTRWTRAGARDPLPFSGEAIEFVSRFSGGVPRVVNAICDAALVNAYGTGKRDIESEDILEVVADLQLVSPDHPDMTPNSRPKALALPPKSPDLPASAAVAVRPVPVKPVHRYMPPKNTPRKFFRLSSWFRFAHTEAAE